MEFFNTLRRIKSYDGLLVTLTCANALLSLTPTKAREGKLSPKKIGTRILYNKEQVMSALEDIDRLKYKNSSRTIDCVSVSYHKRLSTTTFKTINL